MDSQFLGSRQFCSSFPVENCAGNSCIAVKTIENPDILWIYPTTQSIVPQEIPLKYSQYSIVRPPRNWNQIHWSNAGILLLWDLSGVLERTELRLTESNLRTSGAENVVILVWCGMLCDKNGSTNQWTSDTFKEHWALLMLRRVRNPTAGASNCWVLDDETGRFNHVHIASDVTIRINQSNHDLWYVYIYYNIYNIYIYIHDTIDTHILTFYINTKHYINT